MNEKLERFIRDQRWKRKNIWKRLLPTSKKCQPISLKTVNQMEMTRGVRLPELFKKYITTESSELLLINTCTNLQSYIVNFADASFKEIEGCTALKVGECGCSDELWIILEGPKRHHLVQTGWEEDFGLFDECVEEQLWQMTLQPEDHPRQNKVYWYKQKQKGRRLDDEIEKALLEM